MKNQRKPNGYWTKELCKSDALNYKTRKEWQKSPGGAYSTAYKNGWLDECCKQMKEVKKPSGYWTKERCKRDAKKYNIRSEWKSNSSGYSIALNNGWLEECCRHMEEVRKPKGYWTKKLCIDDAKKYKTRTEWFDKSGGAYYGAQKKGWLDDCCKHMRK